MNRNKTRSEEASQLRSPHLLGGLEHSVTEHLSKEAPREIASDRQLMVVLLVPSIDLQGGLD